MSTLACVMVTNGGPGLTRALESIRYYVDNIYVLFDAKGHYRLASQIAHNNSLKSGQYNTLEWKDDFSYAYNLAIEQCKKSDWYMILDDDEIVSTEIAMSLKLRLNAAELADIHGFRSYQRHWMDLGMSHEFKDFGPCWPTRIIKSGVKFTGRVHQSTSKIAYPDRSLGIEHFNLALYDKDQMDKKVKYYEYLKSMPPVE